MASTLPPNRPALQDDAARQVLNRMARRRRLWLALKLLAVLIIMGLALAIYLQSTHALRHVLLPLVGQKLGTRVTAADGSLHFSGQLELKDPEVLGTDGRPAMIADAIVLDVEPLSLLPGRIIAVRRAVLDGLELRVAVDKAGRSNWDFRPEAQDRPAEKKNGRSAPGQRRSAPYPNIRIGELEIKDLAMEYRDASGLHAVAESVNLVAKDLARGQTGTFGLTAIATMERPGEKIQQQGSVTAQGQLTQGSDGRSLGWDGTLSANIKGQAPGVPVRQNMDVKASYKGVATTEGKYTQNFNLAASTPQGPAGQFAGVVNWEESKKTRQATINATGVTPQFLNPLLAALGPVQLTRASVNGTCRLNGVGDTVSIVTEVRGQGLSFKTSGQAGVTPPLDLVINQRGAWKPEQQVLALENAELSLLESGAAVAQARLDRPMELALGTSAGGAGVPARLALTLNRLNMETLKPWLALAGVAEASQVRTGAFSGQLTADVDKAGRALAFAGQLNGSSVRVDRWPNLPLEVQHNLTGRLDEFKTLGLEQARLTLQSGGRALGSLDVALRYDLEKKEGQGQARFATAQVVDSARSFGLLAPATEARLAQDGRLEAAAQFKLDTRGQRMGVEGTAKLEGLALRAKQGSVPLGANAHYRLSVEQGLLHVQPLKVELAQAGGAGVVEASGDWPLADQARRGGELKLTARKVDLAPWLSALELANSQTPQALPFEAEQTLRAQPDGRVRLAGEARLGPLPGQQALTITMKNELHRVGEAIERLTLELAGRGRSGETDKVVLDGTGQGGAAPRLKLNVHVEALTADPYMALVDTLKGPEDSPDAKAARQMERAVAVQRIEANNPGAPAAKTAAQVIDGTLDIKRLHYRKAELRDVKGTMRLENGVFDFNLPQGNLSGGTISANVQYDSAKLEPRYAWTLNAKKVDAPALLSLVNPKWSDYLSGAADVSSRGNGQGRGEAARRRLQSETSFLVADGEMRNFFLLNALAQQTRVESFRNLRYSEFSGHVTAADGVASLKDWTERGKDQMLTLSGTMSLLDGRYKLAIQPAVGPELARRISDNALAQQLLSDQQEYMRFPFQLVVTGEGSRYQMVPQVGLPVAGEGQKPADSLRRVIGGVIEKELLEREAKTRKDKAHEARPEVAPRGENASTSAGVRTRREPVGGLVDGLIQKQLDRAREKQERRRK